MEAEEATSRPRSARLSSIVLVCAVVLLGIGWFLVFDAWWLNSDGSAYLGLGRSFIDGHGFRLPDGEVLAPWDRPAYPVLLTLPWLFHESFEATIWMSRVPLIVAPALIAGTVLRFCRSLAAALLAGVAAVAQPWTLLAGGSNLVPDGLTALATLGSVLAATLAVAASSSRARAWWLGVCLFSVVLASLTKETGAIAVLLVAVVVWNGLAGPRRSLVLAALVATIPVVLAGLVVSNGAPESAAIELPWKLVEQLNDETFAGSPWIYVAGVAAIALVAWSIPHATEPLPLAGLVLIFPAIALGMYAGASGLGMRNAALLPYGAALLLGALVGDLRRESMSLRAKGPRIAVCAALVVGLLGGSDARAWGPADVASRTWDTATTRDVANFLRAHRADGTAACTLQFCSFYWLAADGDVDLRLVPQYSARPGPNSIDDLVFKLRAGFRGPTAARPSCAEHPLVVTKSDEAFGAIFECELLRFVRSARPRYLAVSGSDGSDTFDAGRLIPYLESNPAFRRVYSSPAAEWPPAVAVYEVVGDPRPVRDAPTYYSKAAYDALPADHGRPGVEVLDDARYAKAIQSILARPPAAE